MPKYRAGKPSLHRYHQNGQETYFISGFRPRQNAFCRSNMAASRHLQKKPLRQPCPSSLPEPSRLLVVIEHILSHEHSKAANVGHYSLKGSLSQNSYNYPTSQS